MLVVLHEKKGKMKTQRGECEAREGTMHEGKKMQINLTKKMQIELKRKVEMNLKKKKCR